jgi:hypothetical protein
MNPPRKLTSQQQTEEQESLAQSQETRTQSVQEFVSVEAMLRHDALHTPVPPAIAHRLKESLVPMSPPGKPWWRRIFGS